MRRTVGLAEVCLHVSAVLYVVVAAVAYPLFTADPDVPFGIAFAIVAILMCVALIVVIEVVAWGLRRRRQWAWIGGICLFAIYAPSLYMPLGLLGLWALLDGEVRAEFGQTVSVAPSEQARQPDAPEVSAIR